MKSGKIFLYFHLFLCSIRWIVEILKNKNKTKTKMLSFYKQQSYFSQIVSKKAKITILFFMKNSKNNNIILGFSF